MDDEPEESPGESGDGDGPAGATTGEPSDEPTPRGDEESGGEGEESLVESVETPSEDGESSVANDASPGEAAVPAGADSAEPGNAASTAAGDDETGDDQAGDDEKGNDERGDDANGPGNVQGPDAGEADERVEDATEGDVGARGEEADAPDAADPAAGAATGDGEARTETSATEPGPAGPGPGREDLPPDVRKYDRFTKMDGAQYDRVNEFLRNRTYVTAREWAIARLCADFRTETGVEMTKIGENLPYLVPFMTDTYTPQAVNQARSSFEEKVRTAGATFLYGAMCDFFTAEELDDLMYEVTEVAKFLLEVEGVDLDVADELEAEERISAVMREVRSSSEALRHDGLECPNCGTAIEASDAEQ